MNNNITEGYATTVTKVLFQFLKPLNYPKLYSILADARFR